MTGDLGGSKKIRIQNKKIKKAHAEQVEISRGSTSYGSIKTDAIKRPLRSGEDARKNTCQELTEKKGRREGGRD